MFKRRKMKTIFIITLFIISSMGAAIHSDIAAEIDSTSFESVSEIIKKGNCGIQKISSMNKIR